MKAFTYERARIAGRSRGGRGAHARREVHRRRHQPARPDEARDRDAGAPDRRQRPRRSTRSSRRPTAACASARWCATPTSPPTRACGATTACCRARCWPARRASCATRRRPPATCCSARAARTSTTPTSRATSAQPGSGCSAIGGFSRQLRGRRRRATPASRRIPSDMAVAMRALDATVETVRAGRRDARDPDRRLPPPAGRHAAHRDGARARRADHRGDAAAAGRRRAALPQGARPRLLCVRAGLGRRRSCSATAAGRVALGGVAHKPWRVEAAEARAAAAAPRRSPRALLAGAQPDRTTTHSSCRWSSARSARCWPKRRAEP